MLEFKPITLKDGGRMRPFFRQSPSKQLVNCFEAFYLWRDVLYLAYAEYHGSLIFRVQYDSGTPQFLFPFGGTSPMPALRQLKEYCKSKGYPLRFAKVRKDQLDYLTERFPDEITVSASRDHAEYIYPAELFRNYSGKGLQPKRNLVNYARKNYDWTYEPLSESNLQECRSFVGGFGGAESLEEDNDALNNALSDYCSLALTGGVVRIEGNIAALFICTMLGDDKTAAGLFLRGDHDKKGVIPLLYQEFFIRHPEYEYFNFGEDLGVNGLRKNKLSFHPTELLELYEGVFGHSGY